MLDVVDDVPRERMAAIPETSISGRGVARDPTDRIERRVKPGMVVSDDGTELTGHAILTFAAAQRIERHCIAPGMPRRNGVVARFSRRM